MPTGQALAADLIVYNASVHTLDTSRPRAQALAVTDGRLSAVGNNADVRSLLGPRTQVLDAGGRMVMPGIVDAHSHLGFGGRQTAWELVLSPTSTISEILDCVQEKVAELDTHEWLVGGVIISPLFQKLGTRQMLAALDAASAGRPVMLRDDSLHNRWVNSRAMKLLGISASTADPEGGTYVRDERGEPVGLLLEKPSTDAELAASRSRRDGHERDLQAARTAVSLFNSVGVTTTQDAATMGAWLDVFNELDAKGELTVWVVASLPARQFVEPGPAGADLFATASARTSTHVRPQFVKALLDGVPMTRTAGMLEPYLPGRSGVAPATTTRVSAARQWFVH